MKHLWEIDHPYYCCESNYYAPGREQPFHHYESWQEFIKENEDADFDMNLVFRFDWKKASDDNGQSCDKLFIYWMGQRKGLYRWSEIDIQDADELAVIKFLKPRWDYLVTLWEGISNVS